MGLYVEALPVGCDTALLESCNQQVLYFNPEAYGMLLEEAGVPIHPIDVPDSRVLRGSDRVRHMGGLIREGPEPLKVVLAGNAHVQNAYTDKALYIMRRGRMPLPRPYEDPGDLVERFPEDETLTIIFSARDGAPDRYGIRPCSSGAGDFVIEVPRHGAYRAAPARTASSSPDPGR